MFKIMCTFSVSVSCSQKTQVSPVSQKIRPCISYLYKAEDLYNLQKLTTLMAEVFKGMHLH